MRLIARIDCKNGQLIKTINLEGLRQLGYAKDFALKYMEDGIDEIFITDPVASLYSREPLFDLLDSITDDVFVPVTISGGINSLDHMKKLFLRGADKISINSALVNNVNLLDQAVDLFGSQSIAVSLQVRSIENQFYAFYNCGRDRINLPMKQWIQELESRGAGEFILTSIDYEGLNQGLDLKLLEYIFSNTSLPVSYSGGVGNLSHLSNLKDFQNLSGLCLAGSLHYRKFSISDAKNALASLSIPVRLT